MICAACDKEIVAGERTASSPGGEIHYLCFKLGMSHGEEISLMTVHQELSALKRRVQALEERAKFTESLIGRRPTY